MGEVKKMYFHFQIDDDKNECDRYFSLKRNFDVAKYVLLQFLIKKIVKYE